MLRQPQCPYCHRSLRAAPAPPSTAAAIGVSVGVGVVLVAVVLAALYAWHRLRAPVPLSLITWLTSGGKAPSSGGSGVRAVLSMMPRGPVCRLQVASLPCLVDRCTG